MNKDEKVALIALGIGLLVLIYIFIRIIVKTDISYQKWSEIEVKNMYYYGTE